MTKRVTTILDDREAMNLNLLLAKYGGKASAYFRTLLKQAYEKELGGYKEKKRSIKTIKIDPTPEQICEMLGGKVGKNDSGPVCFEPSERKGLVVPLSLMGHKGLAGDYRIKGL